MEMLTVSKKEGKCIACVMDFLQYERNVFIANENLFQKYKCFWKKIGNELGKSGYEDKELLEYVSLANIEISFFNPQEAYLAGRLAMLNEMDKGLAYTDYRNQMKNQEKYQKITSSLNNQFAKILAQLKTESARKDLYNLERLHYVIYGGIKKELHIFFNLGFDCGIICLDEYYYRNEK